MLQISTPQTVEGPYRSQIPQDILGGGAFILVCLLVYIIGASDGGLIQIICYDRPITLKYQAPPWPQWLNTTEMYLLLLLCVYWVLGGTCPMSPSQADGVVTIWKLLVAVAGGWVLKCFFPDEFLLILHWSQKDIGSAELQESGKLSSSSVPRNGGEKDTGEQGCPSYLTACLPEELPSLLIHLPSLNTVLSPLFSQSTTNTRLFCTSDS